MAKIDDFQCKKGCGRWFDIYQKGSQKGFCVHCRPRTQSTSASK